MIQNLPRDVQNFLNPAGPPLAFLIRNAHAQAAGSAQPIPPNVRPCLSPYFPSYVLDVVRYTTASRSGVSLTTELEQLNANISAMTVDDIIVFRDDAWAADVITWGHELVHVTQYQNMGIDGFAAMYAGPGSKTIEDDAYSWQHFLESEIDRNSCSNTNSTDRYWTTPQKNWQPSNWGNFLTAAVQTYGTPQIYLAFFDWGDAEVPLAAKTGVLSTLILGLRNNAGSTILLTGFTDRSEAELKSESLSEERAGNVADFLSKAGVPRNIMAVSGRGADFLRVPTGPGVREPQNRRVEIIMPSPSSSQQNASVAAGRFYVNNACQYPIDFGVLSQNLSGSWKTWWYSGLAGNKLTKLLQDKKNLSNINPVVYFWAKIIGKDYAWKGHGEDLSNGYGPIYQSTEDSRGHHFKETEVARDSEGDWVLKLTCENAP